MHEPTGFDVAVGVFVAARRGKTWRAAGELAAREGLRGCNEARCRTRTYRARRVSSPPLHWGAPSRSSLRSSNAASERRSGFGDAVDRIEMRALSDAAGIALLLYCARVQRARRTTDWMCNRDLSIVRERRVIDSVACLHVRLARQCVTRRSDEGVR